MSINKQACDKLKSAAAKAVDNFDPNMFVETRDVLALLDELEAKDKRIAELEAREVKIPELKMLRDYLAEVTNREREDILLGAKLEFHRALQDAGIITKVGE